MEKSLDWVFLCCIVNNRLTQLISKQAVNHTRNQRNHPRQGLERQQTANYHNVSIAVQFKLSGERMDRLAPGSYCCTLFENNVVGSTVWLVAIEPMAVCPVCS